MQRFDRYLLSQLTVLFGFFSLVLVSVYWLNQAVRLFDRLIGDGQSVMIFLEFTGLTLPNVIHIVLPVAAFAATLYVVNRMTTESELVVVQAMGYSPFRLARPVFVFGVMVAILVAILNNVLVPVSRARLSERQEEISQNISARLLSEGRFLHPSKDVTVFIREITPLGELRDVFISDKRASDERTAYTAQRARLVAGENGPKLVMFDGLAQTYQTTDQRLFTTRFQDSVFDIAGLVDSGGAKRRSVRELSTLNLLSTRPELLKETGATRAEFLYEANSRFGQPLFAVAGALLGFAALMLGGFSRFGIWRQILLAIVLLIALQLADNAMADIARSGAHLWPVVYLPSIGGIGVALAMLWLSEQPGLRLAGRFGRRRAAG
ncbi:MAG: LPS export ABC transporter permease LptF [Paracoccaceae bacterium]